MIEDPHNKTQSEMVKFNILRLELKGHYFADGISKSNFLNKNYGFWLKYIYGVTDNEYLVSSGSGNYLVWNGLQIITWTNEDQVQG